VREFNVHNRSNIYESRDGMKYETQEARNEYGVGSKRVKKKIL
jgi:hypothetical protein